MARQVLEAVSKRRPGWKDRETTRKTVCFRVFQVATCLFLKKLSHPVLCSGRAHDIPRNRRRKTAVHVFITCYCWTVVFCWKVESVLQGHIPSSEYVPNWVCNQVRSHERTNQKHKSTETILQSEFLARLESRLWTRLAASAAVILHWCFCCALCTLGFWSDSTSVVLIWY